MDFSRDILKWYFDKRRDFPWRMTKNPYKIWLSEIILQQTRTSQGLNYYIKFINTFPKVKDLAEAKEEEVLKLWQGLGYYSRARNLHKSAKYIHETLNGEFPKTYNELLKLKGVGPYTAAAISSICFKEKKAAVDGNVYRILSRVFDIDEPINSSKGIKVYQELADELISDKNPGDYNQALMDLGATLCKPKSPNCIPCPVEGICLAKAKKTVDIRPIKLKKVKVRNRYFNYFCIETPEQFLMKKRTTNDIWKNLYDFPLLELPEEIDELSPKHINFIKKFVKKETFKHLKTTPIKHKLSHQNLHINVFHIKAKTVTQSNGIVAINKNTIPELPVPKPIELFFQQLSNSLDSKG